MSRQPRSPIAAWFRSSRRMLAAELSQGGWLNFGAFRWSANGRRTPGTPTNGCRGKGISLVR